MQEASFPQVVLLAVINYFRRCVGSAPEHCADCQWLLSVLVLITARSGCWLQRLCSDFRSTMAQKYKNTFLKSRFDDVLFNLKFTKMKFTILFTVALCGHQSLSVITSLLCVVVWSPITQCDHQSPLCGNPSLCAATDLPCGLNNLNVRSLILLCAQRSALCSHQSLCSVTDLLCAITDLSVCSLICPARCGTTMCGHQSALYGERSLCGHTELSL